MSPSRLSAGITSGSPADESSSANVASISCGSYGDVGMPRGGGVHLLLEHPLVRRADRVLRPAEDLRAGALRLTERELGDARGRCAARCARCGRRPRRRLRPPAIPSRRTRRRRPCARSRSARARRRAARRRESAGPCARSPCRRSPRAGCGSASRRRRASSGVMVAAFRPSPCSRIAAAASCTTALSVARRFSSERSKRGNVELDPDHVRREDAQRLLEQLLAGLVALEDDDRVLVAHRLGSVVSRE